MYDVFLKQLESLCIEESHFVNSLKKEVGRQNNFNEDIRLIQLIKTKVNIPENILQILTKQGGKFFFEFPPKEEKEHISFFNKIRLLSKDNKKNDITNERYKKQFSLIYQSILKQSPNLALIFEIAYINKAGNYINTYLQNETNRLEKEISFMKEILRLISTAREELSKHHLFSIPFLKTIIDPFPYVNVTEHRLKDFTSLFLAKGFPLSLFLDIHNIFIKEISKMHMQHLIDDIKHKTLLTKSDLQKCWSEEFFIPKGNDLKLLHKIITKQAEKSEMELVKNDRELTLLDNRVSEQTKRIINEKANAISSIITKKNQKSPFQSSYEISEILSEIEKTCLDYIWHLKDFSEKTYTLSEKIEQNRKLQSLTSEELQKMLESEIYIKKGPLCKLVTSFIKIQPLINTVIPVVSRSIYLTTIHLFEKTEAPSHDNNNDKIKQILLKFREKGKKKFSPNIEKIIQAYKKVGNEILLPLLTLGILQRNIEEWPDKKIENYSQAKLFNETNYLALYAIPKGKFYHFSQKAKVKPEDSFSNTKLREKLLNICNKNFRKVISVLVYDIRGSSFMTLKLHNAEREQMIIKNFHSTMANIAKEYGAFLLKDIGDGGIIWFGKNSKELYNFIYRESTTKKFKKLRYSLLSEEGLFLQSAEYSAEKAVLCAIEMVKAAEKFIKDNYVKYRDWFSDIKEKELIIEGTTYALLPPMFRSLFRLGIGIASGIPSRDIAIGPNAFGDPDLRGMLVNEAKFLSEGRNPEESVILIDHDTVLNLLLSTSKFTIGNVELNVTSKEDIMAKVAEIITQKLQGGNFYFIGKNFVAKPFEILSLDKLTLSKYSPSQLRIDEDGMLYNKSGEKVKVLYLVRI